MLHLAGYINNNVIEIGFLTDNKDIDYNNNLRLSVQHTGLMHTSKCYILSVKALNSN